MRIRILILFDADPEQTFHPEKDPDPSFKIKAQTLKKNAKIGSYSIRYILAYLLQVDADPFPVPDTDPVYHFDADPDSDFYLMRMRIRMRIQVTKWCGSGSASLAKSNLFLLSLSGRMPT
jgi:hypothetical protein